MKLPKLPRLLLGPYHEIRRPRFPVDRNLVSKQLRAAESLPANSIKPVLIQENEDTWVKPLDYDEGLPIG